MTRAQVIEEILGLFTAGKKVAIVAHINPDGDAVGSVLALAELLSALGCQVSKLYARETQLPEQFGFLAEHGLSLDYLTADDYQDSPDILIAVDLSQAYRMDKAQVVMDRAQLSVVIDHHPDPDGFADYMFHDDSAAAAGLLVWEMICASGVTITPAMATACYVAVLTDTGRFSFQNTDATVLAAAADMAAAGADPAAISSALYNTRSFGSLKLDARLVERMDYIVAEKVVYSWVTEADFSELGVARDDTESLVGIVRSVADAELAILLREDGIQVRVNLRARGDYNAAKLASDHGGGGHQAAAGFNFAGTIPQAAEAIRHYLESEAVLVAENDS